MRRFCLPLVDRTYELTQIRQPHQERYHLSLHFTRVTPRLTAPYFRPTGSFSIPITKEQQPPGPNVYQIPTNSAEGQVTLHGGIIGWDRRNWTISEKKPSSVTYKHIDDGDEGFPGKVIVYVRTVTLYTLAVADDDMWRVGEARGFERGCSEDVGLCYSDGEDAHHGHAT